MKNRANLQKNLQNQPEIPPNQPAIPANKPIIPAFNPEPIKNNEKKTRKIKLITKIIDKARNMLPNPLYPAPGVPNFKALFIFLKARFRKKKLHPPTALVPYNNSAPEWHGIRYDKLVRIIEKEAVNHYRLIFDRPFYIYITMPQLPPFFAARKAVKGKIT